MKTCPVFWLAQYRGKCVLDLLLGGRATSRTRSMECWDCIWGVSRLPTWSPKMDRGASPGPLSAFPRARGWRACVALMAMIAVGGLVGCSSSAPHREVASRCPSRAPEVVAADYLQGTEQPISAAPFLRAVPGARELSTARALLVGPHSSIALDAIAITNRVGATAACLMGAEAS